LKKNLSGEVLAGDRMMKTLFSLPFEHSFESKKLCSYTLKRKDIEVCVCH
jgi:hypothetical protein